MSKLVVCLGRFAVMTTFCLRTPPPQKKKKKTIVVPIFPLSGRIFTFFGEFLKQFVDPYITLIGEDFLGAGVLYPMLPKTRKNYGVSTKTGFSQVA